MKEEGGCPFTKMCKLAGTPHVGAILIVLFVIAGAAYYFLVMNSEGSLISIGKPNQPLNEEEEIKDQLKQFSPSPRGYIKIMNEPTPETKDARDRARRAKTGAAFVFPEDEKLAREANKGVIDVPVQNSRP